MTPVDWIVVISFFGYIALVAWRVRQNRKGE
jgi:hypothetical protein